MRFCFCSLAYRNKPIEEIIPWLAESGYHSVELFAGHVQDKSDADVTALKGLCDEHNIAVDILSPYFWFTNSDELYAESIECAHRMVELCHLLDAQKIRTFTDCGPTGIGSDVATRDHWQKAIIGLKTITGMDSSIEFVVETHAKTLADTPESALVLLERVDAPNLKINYQPSLGTELAHYRLLKDHIRHLHLQNATPDRKHAYLEDGVMAIPELLNQLHADGYDQAVSVEYCWKDVPWDRAPSAVQWLNSHNLVSA